MIMPDLIDINFEKNWKVTFNGKTRIVSGWKPIRQLIRLAMVSKAPYVDVGPEIGPDLRRFIIAYRKV